MFNEFKFKKNIHLMRLFSLTTCYTLVIVVLNKCCLRLFLIFASNIAHSIFDFKGRVHNFHLALVFLIESQKSNSETIYHLLIFQANNI